MLASLASVSTIASGQAQPRYSLTDLGVLPGYASSAANHINDNGDVVGHCAPAVENFNDGGIISGNYHIGGSAKNAGWRPAIWTEDRRKPGHFNRLLLAIPTGGTPDLANGFATAANKSSQLVGYIDAFPLFGQHAAFWNNNAAHTLVDLGTLPGDGSSIAWGINDFGQVAGESHPAFGSLPVIWSNDPAHTAIPLPLLPGENYGAATAVNNLGQALGHSAVSVPGTWNVGPSRIVIWRDGGVFELQSVLDPATAAGWTITSANGINNLGQIAAVGTHNGISRAIVLAPMQ